MAGDNDDKDKKPKSTPSTETGAGDNPSAGSGKVPPEMFVLTTPSSFGKQLTHHKPTQDLELKVDKML